LDDEQLRILKEAVASIPYRWRERYVSLVADKLMLDTITNASVASACGSVARTMKWGPEWSASMLSDSVGRGGVDGWPFRSGRPRPHRSAL